MNNSNNVEVTQPRDLLNLKDRCIENIKEDAPGISNKQASRKWDKFYYSLRNAHFRGLKIKITKKGF